jgi:hypothetical protein
MITSIEQPSVRTKPHNSEVINLFNDMQWQHETTMGNYLLKTHQNLMAMKHYKAALSIAKTLFTKYQSEIRPPDSLVPIVVISYLNLADFWDVQEKCTNQKNCLIHAFDYLVNAFDNVQSSGKFRDHICLGLNKIYPELIICLQQCGDLKTLEEKKNVLLSL